MTRASVERVVLATLAALPLVPVIAAVFLTYGA